MKTAKTKPLLTARERQVLELVAAGEVSKTIAAALDISIRTVESHRARAMGKIEAQSAAHAVYKAIRLGLIK